MYHATADVFSLSFFQATIFKSRGFALRVVIVVDKNPDEDDSLSRFDVSILLSAIIRDATAAFDALVVVIVNN
uniref:Uncharacterized protein n=1 Tax=Romanomermis culicivorax TaxID=13658 RepID=A0A915KKJ4_ROMCU